MYWTLRKATLIQFQTQIGYFSILYLAKHQEFIERKEGKLMSLTCAQNTLFVLAISIHESKISILERGLRPLNKETIGALLLACK